MSTRSIDSVLVLLLLLPILVVSLVLLLVVTRCSGTAVEAAVTPAPTPCPPCPECPAPTPCPVPFPVGELWVGTSPSPPQPLGVVPARERFHVQRWTPILEPLYLFAEEPPGIRVSDALSGITGTVRMALARPVPNVGVPPIPLDADPAEWVLLVPCTEDHCLTSWQEAIAAGLPAGSGFSSLVIEREVVDVIPFANDGRGLQASVRSLAPALLSRRAGGVGGLWVEALLVRQCDARYGAPCGAPCDARHDARWALYRFANVASPGDGDRRRAYCCNWLRCGQAWRPECTVYCAGVECP